MVIERLAEKDSTMSRWMWTGRSYDLGKMSFRDLTVAFSTYYAILAYLAVAIVSGGFAIRTAHDWVPLAESGAAVIVVYPFAWYLIHRFVLHSRSLYKSKWTAATWKRIHFDHHQDPHEFVHCVQHLNHKPNSEFLKRVKRWHLAHHFHSERGNYGIMSFFPDRLLGTWYDSAKMKPRSATTFNLGYDRAEAERYPSVAQLTGAPPRDRPPMAGEGAAGLAAATEVWMPRRRSGK
jgi:hypothetical protein